MEREFKCECGKIHKIVINDFDIHNPTYTECSWNGYNMPSKEIKCSCGRMISVVAKVQVDICNFYDSKKNHP